jgi:hypothetical protein
MLPDLYFFNPTCEPAIANGSPFYTATAKLRKFETDLGYLPGWMGEERDDVLVQGAVDQVFEDKMRSIGFKLPRFLNLESALSDPEWISQPKNWLRPWGWSPAVYQLFRNILPAFRSDFQLSAIARWEESHKNLYSRLTAIGLLEKMHRNCSESWLPSGRDIPVVCNSLKEIYSETGRHERAVVKTPWSSSGRGLLLFPNVDSRKKNDEILSGMLNQQGFVTVEPWLERVLDLSYQFYSSAGKITYKGRTIFETDQKGRYIRNFIGNHTHATIEVSGFLEEHNGQVVEMLHDALADSDYSTLYEGWLGVDALIYRTSEDSLKFHPMIEINGRYTMGAIALKIRDYLAPGSDGFLQIFYSKSGNFQSFCQKMEAEKPLVMENGKIVSGFLALTPPSEEHKFGAYIEVL